MRFKEFSWKGIGVTMLVMISIAGFIGGQGMTAEEFWLTGKKTHRTCNCTCNGETK
jgi:hypothetical protein